MGLDPRLLAKIDLDFGFALLFEAQNVTGIRLQRNSCYAKRQTYERGGGDYRDHPRSQLGDNQHQVIYS